MLCYNSVTKGLQCILSFLRKDGWYKKSHNRLFIVTTFLVTIATGKLNPKPSTNLGIVENSSISHYDKEGDGETEHSNLW